MTKIGIVVADFNKDITSSMEAAASEEAQRLGAKIVAKFHVPGVYDAPLVVARLIGKKDVEAVVVLGAIIKGYTKHDEVIASAAANAFTQLSIKSGKPVTFGVIGPGATWEQAEKRVAEYARRAVKSAVSLAKELK